MPWTPGAGYAYPTPLSEIGLAIETERGTLAAAPTAMMKVKAPKYAPDQAYLPDDTIQGNMAKTQQTVRGMRYDKHGWDSYPYLDAFPLLVRGELGSADEVSLAPASTTLAAAATAQASTISVTGTVAAGDYVVIDAGASQESAVIASVTGSGPYSATLVYPLLYAHASGAQVVGLNAHRFALLNTGTGQPPSLSLWDYDGEEWRTMSACQLDELTLKGSATALVDCTVSLIGNPATENATAPSVSYSNVHTPPPWTVQFLLGGTQVRYVEDWELPLKRSTKPIPDLTGAIEFDTYFADVLDLTGGKLTIKEQSGSPYLAKYLNGTQETFRMTLFDQSNGFVLDVSCSLTAYTTGEIDRGKEYVTVPLTFEPLPNATDTTSTSGGVSPIAITIANATSTPY